MKKTIYLFVLALCMQALNTNAQCCFAHAGNPKSICCIGGMVTIGASPAGTSTCTACDTILYSWHPTTGLNNSHLPNPTASPTVTTTYTLTVYCTNKTNHDTCGSGTSTVKVTVGSSCCRTTDIATNQQIQNIKLYPNPAGQEFNIAINQLLQSGVAVIYDINGRIVWKKENIQGNETIPVNSSSFQKGVYFVEVTDNNKKVFKDKLIIQ